MEADLARATTSTGGDVVVPNGLFDANLKGTARQTEIGRVDTNDPPPFKLFVGRPGSPELRLNEPCPLLNCPELAPRYRTT